MRPRLTIAAAGALLSSALAAAAAYSPPAAATTLPLAGKVVVIDPGHNGGNAAHPGVINRLVDAGGFLKACDTTGTATSRGYPESAFAFDVATRLMTDLRRLGARVVLTRTTDTGVGPCITTRAAIGNQQRANAAISIHADGGPSTGRGFHVIEPANVGRNAAIVVPSRRLGLDVRDAMHARTGEPYATYVGRNGIDVRGDLGGLNLSTVPKVFIESANMRNAWDAARLGSPLYRQHVANALAAGLLAFLQGR